MPNLSRRALLGSTMLLTLPGFATALGYVSPVDEVPGDGPPVAPVRPVTETLWGVQLTDRYRWMEAEDAQWRDFMRAEGAYTEKVLAAIPGRQALAAAIGKNTGAVVLVTSVQTGGEQIFSEVRPAGASLSKLFVRDGVDGADRLLIDPETYAETNTHSALDWWAPSPDGSKIVFGISTGGSEQSVLHILVTATGALLDERISRTAQASPSWLPDGSGLFYNRYQDVPPDALNYEEDSLCWFHRLGTDPQTDIKIFGKGLHPAVPLQDIDMPIITITPGSDIVIGAVVSGVQNEMALYAASLAGLFGAAHGWKKICGPEDDVTGYAVLGEAIFLLSHKNASSYKILKTTAARPAVADATTVVPPSRAVIRDIVAARDGLYILDLKAGLGGIRRLGLDGRLTVITPPFPGAIEDNEEQAAFYADTLHDGVWFLLEGWVRPCVVCHAGPDGAVRQSDIAPASPIDVSPYTSQEVFAAARDGTRIPLSIITRKDFKRDGTAPLMMEAYGAYGITLDPAFLARWLPFLDLGGALAIAHVRGGGELGEDWHIAGKKLQKYHSWRDAIDCGLYLIGHRWTSPPRFAVWGGSAGGITVGRLMTERPDLAAVVIDAVGACNPLRQEFSPNGPPNIPEFGSISTPDGFRALHAMDPYQHVHDGVKYPAVLLLTGLNDPRVSAWEPAKMTARLQAATASKNPVLLRVETDAGHGFGSTRAQRDRESADTIAFMLWRMGDARFQPGA